MRSVTRRSLLRGALSVTAAASVPLPGTTQDLSSVSAIENVTAGLRLYRGSANGIVFSGADELILIDMPAPDTSELHALYGQAQVLFNTNWRGEHTGANDEIGAAGKRIIAHENTRLWMDNEFTVDWENRRYKARAADALPGDTFYTGGMIYIGAEQIEYGHIPKAHTDGDIWVYFRRADVLVVSDLLAVEGFPVIDYSTGGWIGGFRAATQRLLEMTTDATILVPAVGLPQQRSALQQQLELVDLTYEAVGQAYVNAQSLNEFIAQQPLASVADQRGDPTQFLSQAYRSAREHLRAMRLGVV